jgi:hypothetical protein
VALTDQQATTITTLPTIISAPSFTEGWVEGGLEALAFEGEGRWLAPEEVEDAR